MSSCTAAPRAAASICAWLAPGLASAMFSATLAENKNGSCGTQAVALRKACRLWLSRCLPAQVMRPCCGAHWRSSSLSTVLLPLPVGPTKPRVWPAAKLKPTSCSAGWAWPG